MALIANLRLKCPGVVVSLTLLTLFRKITAVAVELSSDLMSLALLGEQPAGEGGGGIIHIMDYTGRLRQKGIPF